MSNFFHTHLNNIIDSAALLSLLLLPNPVLCVSDAIPRYDFAITLDYPHHRLEAVQHVTIPNTFGVSGCH